MNNRITDTLEALEDKIESIKWLIPRPYSLRKANASNVISIIRKSAGILGKHAPKGTVFENKIRREWKSDFLRRTS